MKKISSITKYSEIEDLFWEAGILERCGFYDFCPIFDFYREKFGAKMQGTENI